MSLTLGLTGMDAATEAALTAAFEQANARLGSAWRLLPDSQADHVVVDMDTMYGPMSWLRLHGAGKRVIGLTSAPRTQADYQLARPFDVDSVAALLQTIAAGDGVEAAEGTAADSRSGSAADSNGAVTTPPPATGAIPTPTRATNPPPASMASVGPAARAQRTQTDYQLARPFDVDSVAALLQTIAAGDGVEAAEGTAADSGSGSAADSNGAVTTPPPATGAMPATTHAPAPMANVGPAAQAQPSGMSSAPAPQDQLPEEHPQPLDEEAAAPSPAPALPASVQAGTLAATTIEPATPPRDPVFADWLAPGALQGRRRYQRDDGPVVLIDPVSRQYFGPTLLKPLAGYFDGSVRSEDFKSVDATWAKESTALGAAQPLSRLQWYGGLLAGHGALLPGHDPGGRYQLTKWPQTEREFPKQFRIATAMMKGPSTLDEVAAASGVPLHDVIDFLNASLVTGYAEFVPEPPPEPLEPPKPAGLFGRLRGR